MNSSKWFFAGITMRGTTISEVLLNWTGTIVLVNGPSVKNNKTDFTFQWEFESMLLPSL